jgi:hypothetical protein
MSEAREGEWDRYMFLLSPGDDQTLHVRFEPIGPDYEIRPGDHLLVRVQSPSDDPVEVATGAGWVNVWGAPDAIIRATTSSGVELDILI